MRLMKQLSLLVGVGMLAVLPLSAAEVTVKGEIVDQVCYQEGQGQQGRGSQGLQHVLREAAVSRRRW